MEIISCSGLEVNQLLLSFPFCRKTKRKIRFTPHLRCFFQVKRRLFSWINSGSETDDGSVCRNRVRTVLTVSAAMSAAGTLRRNDMSILEVVLETSPRSRPAPCWGCGELVSVVTLEGKSAMLFSSGDSPQKNSSTPHRSDQELQN